MIPLMALLKSNPSFMVLVGPADSFLVIHSWHLSLLCTTLMLSLLGSRFVRLDGNAQ